MNLDSERLAGYLHGFFANPDLVRQMEQAGSVAAMHRWDSPVVFQETPMKTQAPPRQNGQARSVSYCFAVIRPNAHLTERYCQMMAQNSSGRKDGRLSDQDLLAEVLSSRYLEMNHDIVMFPSWFNHARVCQKRSREILTTMNWTSFRDLKEENMSQFVAKYGAVHFSSVFAPEWTGSLAQKEAAMDGVSGDEFLWDIGPLGGWIHKDDYLRNFLLPMWLQLRNIYAKKTSDLATNLARMVGCENPTQGLSRAIVTLMSHEIRELEDEGSSARAEALASRA